MIELSFSLTDNETGKTQRVLLHVSGEERVSLTPYELWENDKPLDFSNATPGMLDFVKLSLPRIPVTGYEKVDLQWDYTKELQKLRITKGER